MLIAEGILHNHWLGVARSKRPGRVPRDRCSILRRQPARGLESDYAILVEEQNRGPARRGRLEQAGERQVVDFL